MGRTDEVIMLSLILACANRDAFDLAKRVHFYVKKHIYKSLRGITTSKDPSSCVELFSYHFISGCARHSSVLHLVFSVFGGSPKCIRMNIHP